MQTEEQRPIYDAYLRSPEWYILRQRVISRWKKCKGCLSSINLHVHHKTYVRFGKELDSDLCLVCEKCHDFIHAFYEENKETYSLSEATYAALKILLTKQPGEHVQILPPEGKRKSAQSTSKRFKKRIKRLAAAKKTQEEETKRNMIRRNFLSSQNAQ